MKIKYLSTEETLGHTFPCVICVRERLEEIQWTASHTYPLVAVGWMVLIFFILLFRISSRFLSASRCILPCQRLHVYMCFLCSGERLQKIILAELEGFVNSLLSKGGMWAGSITEDVPPPQEGLFWITERGFSQGSGKGARETDLNQPLCYKSGIHTCHTR